MGFPLYFQILRGRVQGFFFKLGSFFFCQMSCIYLLNSRGGPQSFDFDITYFISNYSYPLVSVLKSASVERFGASRKQDFLRVKLFWLKSCSCKKKVSFSMSGLGYLLLQPGLLLLRHLQRKCHRRKYCKQMGIFFCDTSSTNFFLYVCFSFSKSALSYK